MIFELIFDLLFGFAYFVVDVIPSFDFDFLKFDLSAVSDIINVIAIFLPLPTVVSCLTVVLALDNARLIADIINFVIRKIPFIN